MFIKIDDTNYYVLNAKRKSPRKIFDEIFSRMNKTFISDNEKRRIYSLILQQTTLNKQ